ncbi:Uncharacterised protein [Mycobacteroides abscessus]|nr:Uncharacterised protein [Mycobacteroides abscessus]
MRSATTTPGARTLAASISAPSSPSPVSSSSLSTPCSAASARTRSTTPESLPLMLASARHACACSGVVPASDSSSAATFSGPTLSSLSIWRRTSSTASMPSPR